MLDPEQKTILENVAEATADLAVAMNAYLCFANRKHIAPDAWDKVLADAVYLEDILQKAHLTRNTVTLPDLPKWEKFRAVLQESE